MLRHPHHGPVIAERAGAGLNGIARQFVGVGGAAEQPQITAGRFADDRPGIVIRMVEHPVITDIEGAKERNLELGIIAARHDFGLAICRLHRARDAAPAAGVDDIDAAVVTPAVFGGYAFAVRLEAVLIAADFVPQADIARRIDRLGRLRHRRIADGATGYKAGAGGQGQESAAGHGERS